MKNNSLSAKDNPNSSLTHRTLSSLFWMFSGAGVQAVLRIIVLAVLARLLTPADFGLILLMLRHLSKNQEITVAAVIPAKV